ncbi:Uncharacterised protein [Kluyvera cryocrescens]|nr:Uncharacterised protein [Kluyvera cryocrescens]
MLDFTNHLLLQRQIFKYRFNHHVTMRKTTIVRAAGNDCQLAVTFCSLQMTTADFLLQLIPTVFQGMVNTIRVNIFNPHRQPAFYCRDVSNAPSHQATAKNADRVQRASLDAGARIFFQIGAGKEYIA